MKTYILVCLCILTVLFPKETLGETLSIQLFSDERNAEKTDSIAMAFIIKAYDTLLEYNIDAAKLYLDSASDFLPSINNKLILGKYYHYYGIYYSYKLNEIKAHQMYYEAIKYYDEIRRADLLIPVYHNLAYSYIQKDDTRRLENIITKMSLIPHDEKDSSSIANTYRIIMFYYNCLYQKDKREKAYLDSAIYYDSKIISIYENTKNSFLQKEEIAYNYLSLASNLLEKEPADINLANKYLEESEILMNKRDSTLIINQYWVKAKIAYKQQNYAKAERILGVQLSILNDWAGEEALSMHAESYEMLANISEAQQKSNAALEYERKRISYLNLIHDTQKYEIIRDLETKYEVQQKDQEIVQLTELNSYRQKINDLYLCLIILAIAIFLFFIHWIRQKRKATEAQMELNSLEKREALMQVRLKEEKLKKIELEKYEALLESHFKGEQISEMDEELKDLRSEQSILNLQITKYADKVKEYELRKSQHIVFSTQKTNYTSLLRDVFDLVVKRLTNYQEVGEYKEKLLNIEDLFFEKLNIKSTEPFSSLNIKYCICFYIDMKTDHIAECFSVESRSILITRHRMKMKLNINKEMDINTFLKQIVEEENK